MLLAPAAVYLPLVAALVLTFVRTPRRNGAGERTRLVLVFLIGVAVQFTHFSEDYSTALYRLYPRLFGLAPVPAAIFFRGQRLRDWSMVTCGAWRQARLPGPHTSLSGFLAWPCISTGSFILYWPFGSAAIFPDSSPLRLRV